MKIKEIKAKSILVKSNLPEADYVINAYTGCPHGCIYCYARFMKRFTNHKEKWGEFVDIKINALDLIPSKDLSNKTVIISSVTDPYNYLEKEYKLTRNILKKLIPLNPKLNIITKSNLIIRDLDLLKQFKDCTIAISFSNTNEKIQKIVEPRASSPKDKISALKKLKESGIYTVLFMSPIFPKITDWEEIINQTKNYVDEYWFENLNMKPYIKLNVNNFLNKHSPNLIKEYNIIYSKNSNYWENIEKEIKNYCNKHNIKHKIFFHHNK